MSALNLSVSHYHDTQELSYTEFELTDCGLRAARELLATRTVNRFRYGLSPWQFDDPYGGQLEEAYFRLEANDTAGLARLLRESAPQP